MVRALVIQYAEIAFVLVGLGIVCLICSKVNQSILHISLFTVAGQYCCVKKVAYSLLWLQRELSKVGTASWV